jgi:hypothetical protein
MLAWRVTANIHVALQGSRVQGLECGQWYENLRPFFSCCSCYGRSLFRVSFRQEQIFDRSK